LLASEKLKVSPGAVDGVRCDPEVEKEKLAFEKQKWEAQQKNGRLRWKRNVERQRKGDVE